MPITATSIDPLLLLAPSSVLPGEGEELSSPSWSRPASGVADLFRAFQELAAPRAARFMLSGSDVAYDGNFGDECALELIRVGVDEEAGLPQIEARTGMSHFDWAGVVREVGHAMLDEHFLGTPEETARVFTQAAREVTVVAAAGFVGTPVPLLVMERKEDHIVASLLGIWLAGDAQLAEMRQKLPARSWQDGAGLGQAGCLLFDAAEVEGRGLKEIIASAAMLAVVLGSGTAQGADGRSRGTAGMSRYTSFFGGDSKRGEKLQVKSQRLVQDSPRIFREVLDASHCDMRVIINIGAQRAYLVKDGRIAFDTPISSAATGHRTPRGTFAISEKVRSGKMSTIYKCPLPGWMRLGETAVGMHQGDLPGYPASHGCIRMPLESALFIFDHVQVGTPVDVVDSWSPQPVGKAQPALVAQAN